MCSTDCTMSAESFRDLSQLLCPIGYDWDEVEEEIRRRFDSLGLTSESSSAMPSTSSASSQSAITQQTHFPIQKEGRSATVMQKILFSVKKVDSFLANCPNAKIILVAPKLNVKQYSQCLKERCKLQVCQSLLESCGVVFIWSSKKKKNR